MELIKNDILTEERAIYQKRNLKIVNVIFDKGESPMKECNNVTLEGVSFRGRYPVWYCKDINSHDIVFHDTARAGVWYTNNFKMERSMIASPKNIRRCNNVYLKDVVFTNAPETLWYCSNVNLKNITVNKGTYFAMNSENIYIENLILHGQYTFDNCKNIEIHNSRLLTKDAFWNSENVTVYDSFISSEYLGWNSKNLTFINCTIQSLQGLCYVDNLIMKNCNLTNTTFAFEFSSVNAEISCVDSILNPKSGFIKASRIGELIMEKNRVDPSETFIQCDDISIISEKPNWINEN